MRPILFGLLAVFVLFLGVAVYTIFTYPRQDPQTAIGLAAVFAIAIQPLCLVLYAAGFGVTYWLTRAAR